MTYIEQFWRNATAADVARVMAGEVVEARFRDRSVQFWGVSTFLKGVKLISDGEPVWLSQTSSFNQCQVYDPPQWFVDKPEPGEGYRLLEKSPDEPVQGGDFFKNTSGVWVKLAYGFNPNQQEGIWYRRRIDQPKPEPKHYVLQVGDTAEFPGGVIAEVSELRGLWLK